MPPPERRADPPLPKRARVAHSGGDARAAAAAGAMAAAAPRPVTNVLVEELLDKLRESGRLRYEDEFYIEEKQLGKARAPPCSPARHRRQKPQCSRRARVASASLGTRRGAAACARRLHHPAGRQAADATRALAAALRCVTRLRRHALSPR